LSIGPGARRNCTKNHDSVLLGRCRRLRRGRSAAPASRQRRQLVHAADDFEHRGLHVGPGGKLQVDERVAGIRECVERLHAAQSLQRALLRLEDLGFDFFGRGRAPAGEDGDHRLFDIGEELDR
jgi:hypothetical protein